jgi:hypothetical protein
MEFNSQTEYAPPDRDWRELLPSAQVLPLTQLLTYNPRRFGSNDVFSSSPVMQRQNQQQQQFQQSQPTSGDFSQLIYQPGVYPVTTISTAQSQNITANTNSPFPTWSPEVQYPIQRTEMPVSSRPRAHSMAANSLKNLSLTPRIQTSFLSTPIILDPGTSSLSVLLIFHAN